MPVPSTVLEPDVAYCSVDDVERWLRGVTIDSSSDPSTEDVEAMIRQATDYIDTQTNRAWRERKVEGWETGVEFHREATNSRLRHRRFRSSGGRQTHKFRGRARLPNPSVRDIDPDLGDKIEALLPTMAKDLTPGEGRGRDDSFVMDYGKGVVKPSVYEFRATRIPGDVIASDPRIRATYRYGEEPDTTTDGNLEVINRPERVKEACAKRVAAELHENDDYGMTMNSGGEGRSVDETASQYRQDVDEFINTYRWMVMP